MTCDEARERLAGSWLESGGTGDAELKLHLKECGQCRAESESLGGLWHRLSDLPAPEPSQALDARWESTMDAILAAQKPQPRRWSVFDFWPRKPVWQAAIAFACLVIGVVTGMTLRRDNTEISKLHDEIASTRAMVALSLLQQQSATERLRGIDYSGRLASMEPEVLNALIQAVDRDPSVNVRLAAIDALTRAAGDGSVLRSLTASLIRQDSPMVQAALVDYLADAHDRAAVTAIRQLDAEPMLDPAVHARAQAALRVLSQ
jgi:hypothetical protein